MHVEYLSTQGMVKVETIGTGYLILFIS